MGDDDANLEDDFITWKEKFWTSAMEELKLEVVGDDFSTRQYEIKVTLFFCLIFKLAKSSARFCESCILTDSALVIAVCIL